MSNYILDMNAWGFDDFFKSLAENYPSLFPARVISQEKGFYRVVFENGECYASISGKYRHEVKNILDYPSVGDFVMIEPCEEKALIQARLSRKGVFLRSAAGTSNTEQVIAANVDTAFICMSLGGDFNLRRLERYLSVVWESGANPVVVLTKTDLCENVSDFVSKACSVAVGADVICVSAFDKSGTSAIEQYLTFGKTVSFIGSSGVGKSTLINLLLGEEKIKTGSLRADGKGRHTTTKREMFMLSSGAVVIDTPGMRELGMWDTTEGIEKAFDDIEKLSALCRFSDCSHKNEPGCAVQNAIKKGELSAERLLSFQKLQGENEYIKNSESYLASKKRKFKEIAKYNKTNKKR